MTQRDRDRLVVLKKARKKLITQEQAGAELQLSERQIRRLLKRLEAQGDRAVVHALRGRASNSRLSEELRQKALAILSLPEWKGFGPTLVGYHLAKDHQIRIGREALRRATDRSGASPSLRHGNQPGATPAGTATLTAASGTRHSNRTFLLRDQ